jgi:ribosome-binding protein aMBF1 (putative translation factor)
VRRNLPSLVRLLYMYSNRMSRQPVSDDDRRHGERLGKLLGAARGAEGRSAQELAQAASLSIDTVRSLESGRVPTPSFVTVAKVARVLRLSLDELNDAASSPDGIRRRKTRGRA